MFMILFLSLLALIALVALAATIHIKEDRIIPGIICGVITIVLIATIGFSSFVTIETKYVGILKTFGVVNERVLRTGVNFKLPWQDVIKMNIWQRTASRDEDTPGPSGEIIMIGKDKVKLETYVSLHWKMNPSYARLVYENFGYDYEEKLIYPVIDGAIPRAGKNFTWEEIAAEKRFEVEKSVTHEFKISVIAKLEKNGISKDIASDVFLFPRADLQKVIAPPNILEAVEQKKAALQNLERQKTLTEIESERSNRRAKEGEGIQELFKSLPVGFNPNNLPQLLQALALKNIVEKKDGDNDIAAYVITGGGSAPAVSVGTSK